MKYLADLWRDKCFTRNGGPRVSTDEPFYCHDFIDLSPRTTLRIIEKCAPLYEKGLSLRDIEERTGIAKSTIREALTKSGFALRNPLNGNTPSIDSKRTKRGDSTPFGYAYLDGELLMDPKEQIALRKILSLWNAGKSYQGIANELNRQKVPTRLKGLWRKCVVLSIIRRQKENK
ncbi:MAG: recombinase family protein [Bacteriovoracaceae bacterium]